MQFLSLVFPWVLNFFQLEWTLLVFEFSLGTSQTFLCITLVHPSKLVPPPDVLVRQIQYEVILMSTEGKV
jgi:hypothetical protein